VKYIVIVAVFLVMCAGIAYLAATPTSDTAWGSDAKSTVTLDAESSEWDRFADTLKKAGKLLVEVDVEHTGTRNSLIIDTYSTGSLQRCPLVFKSTQGDAVFEIVA
jgi:hypothetical protein